MEKNKNENDLLLAYIDSIEPQNIFNSYKIKKIPPLNQYAENYLANLKNIKSNNDINNNNSIKNYNDNTSNKGLSNDITNNDSIMNTNIQTNQISKINENFYSNIQEEYNALERPKTNNILAIEHLKQNFQIKNKISYSIAKTSEINIPQNNDIDQLSNINTNKDFIQNRNKQFLPEFYKKFSPSERTKLNSPLFSAFKSSDSNFSSSYKVFMSNNNKENLNFSKSVNSYNGNRSSKSKSFFFNKIANDDNNIKVGKSKKKFSIYLYKNILANYLYSDRDKPKKKKKKNTKKKNIRIQMKYFDSNHNEESHFHSTTNRNNISKSYSQPIEDYWKEKELKKQIKIEKIRKEKLYKENLEMRDRPKINENSRRIANRISSNSSLNVFDRLFELNKNKLIYIGRKVNYNHDGKIKINKEKNFNNLKRNKKEFRNGYKYQSFKQINNNKFIEKNNTEENKILILSNFNKFINVKENQRYNLGNIEKSLKFSKKEQKQCNYKNNIEKVLKLNNKSLDKNKNNLKKDFVKPKIMYKKIKVKKKMKGNNEMSRKNITEHNFKYIDNDINYKLTENSEYTNFNKDSHTFSNNKFKGSFNKNYTDINVNKSQKIYPIKSQIQYSLINKNKYLKIMHNINNVKTPTNRYSNINDINDNIYLRNNYNSIFNYNYDYDNKNDLNNFTDIKINNNNKMKFNKIKYCNLLNNKKKNFKTKDIQTINIKFNNDEYLISNKLIKSYNNKSDYNKINEIIKKKNENLKIKPNLIDTKKYFKIPQKNMKTYYSVNLNDFNKDNILIHSNKSIKIEKDNNIYKSYDLNKILNLGNNYIDNHKYGLFSEQAFNIKKRKLELLKLFNFSSSLNIDNNNNI